MNMRAAFISAGGDPEVARAYILIADYLRDTSPAAQSVKGLTAKLRKHNVSYETITTVAMEAIRGDLNGRPGDHSDDDGTSVQACRVAGPLKGEDCDDQRSSGSNAPASIVVATSPTQRPDDHTTFGNQTAQPSRVVGSPKGEETDQDVRGSDAPRRVVPPSPTERPDDRAGLGSSNGAQFAHVVGSPKGPSSPDERSRDQMAFAALSGQAFPVSGAPQSRAIDQREGVAPADRKGSVTARPPAREPSDAFRRALISDRVATARLQLDLHKTCDGRPWSKTGPWEGKGVERDALIHKAIREAYGPFSPKQERLTYGEFLPDAIFQKALKLVEASRDAR